MRSFIPWVGGKSRLAKHIVSLIPEHTCYCEPFMGAAWVFFAKERSKVEVLNDLNGDLVNLFQVVRDRFDEFYNRRIWLIASERDYRDFVRRLADNDWRNDIERPLMFWYCLKQSFGAKIGGGWGFSRKSGPKGLGMDSLKAIHKRLTGVYINNQDVLACLARWDSPETLFYLDPPYMMTTTAKGKGCYRHTMEVDAHHELACTLAGLQGRWLLSYDDDPQVRELYADYYQLSPETRYTTNNRPGTAPRRVTELLIANYELPPAEAA